MSSGRSSGRSSSSSGSSSSSSSSNSSIVLVAVGEDLRAKFAKTRYIPYAIGFFVLAGTK